MIERIVYISKDPEPLDKNENMIWIQIEFQNLPDYIKTVFRMQPDKIVIDNKSFNSKED